jgi:hypothetical protein
MTIANTQALSSPAKTAPRSHAGWAAGRSSRTALSAVLAIAGVFTSFTGLNRALGGMQTMGWQGSTEFLRVVAEHEFLIQDNHTRFLGGVWTGVGLLLLISAFNPKRFQPSLNFIFAIIFLGGLTRFTAMRPEIVFGPDIVGSLIAELILMPLLFVWVRQAASELNVR